MYRIVIGISDIANIELLMYTTKNGLLYVLSENIDYMNKRSVRSASTARGEKLARPRLGTFTAHIEAENGDTEQAGRYLH